MCTVTILVLICFMHKKLPDHFQIQLLPHPAMTQNGVILFLSCHFICCLDVEPICQKARGKSDSCFLHAEACCSQITLATWLEMRWINQELGCFISIFFGKHFIWEVCSNKKVWEHTRHENKLKIPHKDRKVQGCFIDLHCTGCMQILDIFSRGKADPNSPILFPTCISGALCTSMP